MWGGWWCVDLLLGHLLNNLILFKGLFPIASIKGDSVGGDDGVAGDAVGHDPHPVLVRSWDVETLHSTSRTKLMPSGKHEKL